MLFPPDPRWPLAIRRVTEQTRAGELDWQENDGRYPYRSFSDQEWSKKHPYVYVVSFRPWQMFVGRPPDAAPALWFSYLDDVPVQIQVEGLQDLYDAVVEHTQRVRDKFLDDLLVELASLKPTSPGVSTSGVSATKSLSRWKRFLRWVGGSHGE